MQNRARPPKFKGYFVDNAHVFAALEEATRPVTVPEFVERLCRASGEDASDQRRKELAKRIRGCLRYHVSVGNVKRITLPGDRFQRFTLPDRPYAEPARPLSSSARFRSNRPALYKLVYAHLLDKTPDLVLDALRGAQEPLNHWEVARIVAKAAGLEATNDVTFLVRERVAYTLRRLRDKGLVYSADGTRERQRWAIKQ